jgi:dUTP pyrophosphatase
MRESVRIYKTRPEAKVPSRAHATDAGMDFFYCPPGRIVARRISPGESALLQTGVKVEVPPSCMLQIMNKSGIASKKHLVTGACVVDEGYDGEIFVNLHNIGDQPQFIEPGQKIAQGVFVLIASPLLQVIEEDDIYAGETSRGSGALGSTGDK